MSGRFSRGGDLLSSELASMTEWLNVQSIFQQLAGVVLGDLLNHDQQERHVLCYVGLSSKHQYNGKTLSLKLKEALQRHIRKGKEASKYANLAQAEILVDSEGKRLFIEVLCTLLAADIQVFDSTDDSVLMFGRPAAHINPLRAVPYKITVRTKNIIKPDLFGSALSSPSSSDPDSSSAASEDDNMPSKKLCAPAQISEDDLGSVSKKPKLCGTKKKVVKFENLDQGASQDLLGTWSKQAICDLDKRKQVLQNVCLFIDRFKQQVENHVSDCQQCPVHCYSALNKRIKKVPGRPPKKH